MIPLALLPIHYPRHAVDKPILECYQDYFVVRRGSDVWREPVVAPEPAPVLAAAFRKNQNYAVWDDRGLTIRRGSKALSTRFPAVPTSPKFFEREELVKTIELLKAGKRVREAAGLSGSMRIGNEVFFLVRWEGSDGKPWAEVLAKVDLTSPSMKPEVIGQFPGLSVAFRPIDDRLFRIGSSPSIIARTGSTWGTASFDLKSRTFSYRPLGATLVSLYPVDRKESFFVEESSYGTTIGGRVNTDTGERRNLFELRASGRFADIAAPSLMVTSGSGVAYLRNGNTGAEAKIPSGASVRKVGPYAVVFSPAKSPTRASLFEVSTLAKVADWTPKAKP